FVCAGGAGGFALDRFSPFLWGFAGCAEEAWEVPRWAAARRIAGVSFRLRGGGAGAAARRIAGVSFRLRGGGAGAAARRIAGVSFRLLLGFPSARRPSETLPQLSLSPAGRSPPSLPRPLAEDTPPPLSVHPPTGLRTPPCCYCRCSSSQQGAGHRPAMASPRAMTEAAQPQPPPSPKSPPTYTDVCGRHRLQVGLQTLKREIGFLEALKRAIESDWLMLLEEVGLWIPAEVVNKEIDDKPEKEQEPGKDWILQYDPPDEPKEYIHRVGRTARGEGGRGRALLFLIPEEMQFLSYLKAAKVPLKEYEFDTKMLANAQSHLIDDIFLIHVSSKIVGGLLASKNIRAWLAATGQPKKGRVFGFESGLDASLVIRSSQDSHGSTIATTPPHSSTLPSNQVCEVIFDALNNWLTQTLIPTLQTMGVSLRSPASVASSSASHLRIYYRTCCS
ncbi:hypothetical protein Taro_000560, partial [Colocasia esculenta]|nr:hypothetical protein [Colocasia esculenta]